MPLDINKRVAQYVALRDRIQELTKQHEEAMKPMKELLQQIGGQMLNELDAQKAESIRTEAGTVYSYEKVTTPVADPEAFLEFVRSTERWELLERRASPTACQDYLAELMKAHEMNAAIVPTPPPGVNFNRVRLVGVRRA